ncbi:hypothetical protein BOX15_Mlig017195g4 [Macrostomum lignano]|uniref:Tyrosine-protein kinase ephrin type A/B receptor-like domain-containing protein n=1 Tax=Macrostomum lignano TaxID=282301 RepID=A0A267EB01_9PLAT|nr:hypothetical protein BOX15_Mlig017195g4 [Macrostomum lignano]
MAACLKLHVLPLLAPVVLQLVICLATDAISFGLSSGSKKRTPATVTGPRTRATKKRSFGTSGNGSSSPFDTETNSPFMFLLRSAINNPVTYLHSVLVDQLVIVPCYYGNDGRQFGISNQLDMAWYRRLDSMHHPRTFPSINDGEGKLVVMEPIIGHNWFLCDTAFTSKVQHAKKYNMFYSEFKKGQLNMDWNYYQDFSEFSRGQFKHHLFANELAVTEIFVFMNATLKIFRSGASFDIEKLTRPQEMGLFKLTLLRLLESECRDNVDQYCENPTVDILIPVFDNENSVTIQGKLKLYLSNQKLLKLGAESFIENRKNAIKRNAVRWNITGQSIDLGPLGSLNPHPLLLTLVITAKPQVKSDCVGSGSYLSVKYDWECVLCRPGYHLKNQPWIQAASEKNSICHMCPVGTYSSDWGSVDCHECPPSYTTRKVGSTKQFDCIPVATYKMENNIKELLTYFGVDESDEYKKFTMLAVFLLSPWLVFVICLLVSLAYGYSEVTDSEKRFQLERELGSILLRIRRNYNVLMAEHQRL